MGLNDVYGYRALEIERGDLLDTYRTCLQEKRKADSDLNAMRYHVHSHEKPFLFVVITMYTISTMKLKFVQQIQDLQNKLADYNNELISKRNSDEQNVINAFIYSIYFYDMFYLTLCICMEDD